MEYHDVWDDCGISWRCYAKIMMGIDGDMWPGTLGYVLGPWWG